jgi:phosphopantothenoylcysteine decarboxylase/phosphopantothenate--cysteine ligase
MHCLVTAGPTCEPLDQVRRLTNLSTGRLGVELAAFLSDAGHRVTLLLGAQATWHGPRRADVVEVFDTTSSLRDRLAAHAGANVEAVFHAAAVSDFAFGRVWSKSPSGALAELKAGKLSTGDGVLLAELKPTAKLIASLRNWFPQARLVGWKYEVDGTQQEALTSGRNQIELNRTDACVANGPAYGPGFGWITLAQPPVHLPDRAALFSHLNQWLTHSSSTSR